MEQRLRAPDRESRAEAAAAIWRVTGRTHDTAPVIADLFTGRGTRHGTCHGTHCGTLREPHLRALRTLRAMRLLPSAARPVVEHIARSPRRVASGFPCDGTPHPDLAARELARALLASAGTG
ncbi:hypothetical protein [Streptomyces sp. MST-110588]|uniref:hypothetical protein n=1 Tax=Streptomyces sp. MST-110588 TaxID=2833628 RepID=UPI001F5D4B3D|nr:hypothetical protein [Streptomyces sp. MST-110588]UNO39075.1 hypothetical protein KGS77_04820 [Streptomyces sp. MST-110588]